MILTYFGEQCFKVQQGDTVLAFNPQSKDATAKPPRFGADVVFSSVRLPLYNGVSQMQFGDREPFVIDGPGEYEVQGIQITGVLTHSTIGSKEYLNTIFRVTLEDTTLAFLGALSQIPKTETKGMMGNPDILFVPVGGDFLSPGDAYKLAVSYEPHIIIPMAQDEKSLQAFCKEAGVSKPEHTDKLVLKKKDIVARDGDIIIFDESKS